MSGGPKPSVDEYKYVPPTPSDKRWLLWRLIETGTGPGEAWNIVRVLDNLPDPLDKPPARSTAGVQIRAFRRRLALVGELPWESAEQPMTSYRRGPFDDDQDVSEEAA